MGDFTKAMYLTDDRDRPDDEQRAPVIFQGGNGDWYVPVALRHGREIHAGRISTSGGAATYCPGLGVAIADAWRAMVAAQSGEQRPTPVPRDELEREIRAWRCRFPCLQFDGFLDIEDRFDDDR